MVKAKHGKSQEDVVSSTVLLVMEAVFVPAAAEADGLLKEDKNIDPNVNLCIKTSLSITMKQLGILFNVIPNC